MTILIAIYILSAIVSFIGFVILLRRDEIFLDDIESTFLIYTPLVNTVSAIWVVRQLLKE